MNRWISESLSRKRVLGKDLVVCTQLNKRGSSRNCHFRIALSWKLFLRKNFPSILHSNLCIRCYFANIFKRLPTQSAIVVQTIRSINQLCWNVKRSQRFLLNFLFDSLFTNLWLSPNLTISIAALHMWAFTNTLSDSLTLTLSLSHCISHTQVLIFLMKSQKT